VWEEGRLAFERLQQRPARRGKGAREAAGQWPAHYVAFDLVHVGGTDLTGWTYRRRRAALEALFTEHGLAAPLTLCPSTTDPTVAARWLGWTAAGPEGLCFKRLDAPYRPVRSWRKYKVRVTTEAIVAPRPRRSPPGPASGGGLLRIALPSVPACTAVLGTGSVGAALVHGAIPAASPLVWPLVFLALGAMAYDVALRALPTAQSFPARVSAARFALTTPGA
jgi:hypothetical protein